MGKNRGSSTWFSAVKKAFRSPSKDNVQNNSDKRSCRSKDLEQQERENRRGKRRWSLGKSLNNKDAPAKNTKTHHSENASVESPNLEDKKHAMEVAKATAAAAEAAVATAQAAVEFIRITRPCILVKENNQAAVTIQKSFRGYLARRALRALKGLVKLQALVRGHNVRKRTTLTLTRMQALLRVQTRVCDQRRRLSVSREGSLSSASFTDKYPTSKKGEWDENESFHSLINSISMAEMTQQEADWSSERDLACTFAHKIWRSRTTESEEKLDGAVKWREAIQCERPGRYSCDQRTTPIKTLEVDNTDHQFLSNFHKLKDENPYQQTKVSPYSSFQSTTKTYQPELKNLRVHSASPRCLRQEGSMYNTKSQTPRFGCSYRNSCAVPSYMAETASAKARIRSHSVPREQGPSTPEREGIGIAKRRLFFGSSEEVASPSGRNTSRMQR
ncbi:Protein IQ-DOMAIN 14 [Bienertia sinuspersici]